MNIVLNLNPAAGYVLPIAVTVVLAWVLIHERSAEGRWTAVIMCALAWGCFLSGRLAALPSLSTSEPSQPGKKIRTESISPTAELSVDPLGRRYARPFHQPASGEHDALAPQRSDARLPESFRIVNGVYVLPQDLHRRWPAAKFLWI